MDSRKLICPVVTGEDLVSSEKHHGKLEDHCHISGSFEVVVGIYLETVISCNLVPNFES